MQGVAAEELYNKFLDCLKSKYEADKIKDGKFGAYMQVHIVNDGPVTLELESKGDKEKDNTNKTQWALNSINFIRLQISDTFYSHFWTTHKPLSGD